MTNRHLVSVPEDTALSLEETGRRPCLGKVELDAAAHDRTTFIGHLAGLVREPGCPAEARDAAMILIGWLARRMPGECAHAVGASKAADSFDSRKKRA
jgi:hypothetical protein